MNILDYIILGCFIAGIIIGVWKGFLQQIFALVGVFAVAIGTSYLSPYVSQWLSSIIATDGTRSLVAIVITFLVLLAVYGIISKLISGTINKTPVLGGINRLLGAVFAVAVVYLVASVLVSLLMSTPDELFAGLKDLLLPSFEESWIVTNIYGGRENPERNFFGNWLMGVLQDKLAELLSEFPDATQPPQAQALFALLQLS